MPKVRKNQSYFIDLSMEKMKLKESIARLNDKEI